MQPNMSSFEGSLWSAKLAEVQALTCAHDSWVMAAQNGEAFVKLPNERIEFTSNPRVYLQISPPASIANVAPYSVKSDSGMAYVTNQRVCAMFCWLLHMLIMP